MGARHGEFVDDETCDRFCILGSSTDHVAKLRELEAIGVTQWNIYLMTERPGARRSRSTAARSSPTSGRRRWPRARGSQPEPTRSIARCAVRA